MALTNSAHCISIRQVQATVARAFDLTVAEMLSSSRTRRVTRARHVAMYLSREVAVRRARPADRAETPGTLPPPSFPRLGLAFARDHSSVIYACRIVRRRLRDDLGFATLLDRPASDVQLRAALAAAPASDVQLRAALAAARTGGRLMDPFRSLTLRLLMPADARTPADRPRDHSSVIYACRIVRRRLRDDLGFATLLDRLAGDLHLRAATTQEAAHYRVAFAAAPASHVQLHAALAATTQEAA